MIRSARPTLWDRLSAVAKIPAALVCAIGLAGSQTLAQQGPSRSVKTLSPEGAIKPTGTWNVATRAGDFIFIAGMRGIDPTTNGLIGDHKARIRQAFLNMKLIAESEGATLQDSVRLVVFVTDMFRFRPLVMRCRQNYGATGLTRLAPSSRCTGSIRTTS
jgi:2-iminobutanoate/2-iminopropanoate deaminase